MNELKNYMSNTSDNVYAIYNLPEEVIAVLFAFYSRSEGSLRENLQKMINEGHIAPEPDWVEIQKGISSETYKNRDKYGLDYILSSNFYNKRDLRLHGFKKWINFKENQTTEQAKQFHEKWVVGYSHSSVAEHAVIHLAVENISMLAAKAIEDCRLASYTEKSTRYVDYGNSAYHIPKELEGTYSYPEYTINCDRQMKFYNEMIEHVTPKIQQENPELKPYQVRAKACDACRGFLPASVHTNIGITSNARELEHMITKLMSNKSEEIRSIGEKIKKEALKVCPTLIKYADKNDYMQNQENNLKKHLSLIQSKLPEGNEIQCTSERKISEEEIIEELAIHILYSYSESDLNHIRKYIKKRPQEELKTIILDSLKNKGAHDAPTRAFEFVDFEHEVTIDFASYRDIQRHRMATQLTQLSHPNELSYFTPDFIKNDKKLNEKYNHMMLDSYYTYLNINSEIDNDFISQYCLPMNFTKRILFKWNLRELFHFIELRSKPQGHDNYRKLAQDVWLTLSEQCPFIAKLINVCLD